MILGIESIMFKCEILNVNYKKFRKNSWSNSNIDEFIDKYIVPGQIITIEWNAYQYTTGWVILNNDEDTSINTNNGFYDNHLHMTKAAMDALDLKVLNKKIKLTNEKWEM